MASPYILHLPSWFPSNDSPQNGDFIYRHIVAVSRLKSNCLLYVFKDEISQNKRVDLCANSFIFYYSYKLESRNSFVRFARYFSNNWRQIKFIFSKFGKPELVHVHVSFRAGLMALFLKWIYGIPYIISEHWTIFTKERNREFKRKNVLFKWVLKCVFKNSDLVLPVSHDLDKNLKFYFPAIKSVIIPNVVDQSIFYLENTDFQPAFNFIHVSSGNPIKNLDRIVNSYLKLSVVYKNIKLTIIGVDELNTPNGVRRSFGSGEIEFLGRIDHEFVGRYMRKANSFVLFSDYETQSCVSIEALCCGLPVISSRLPCIEEFITEENGILVSPGDEEALYKAMEEMIVNYSRFDRKKISEEAQSKYNPEVVGKQIADVYEKVLSKKPGK